MRLHPLANSVPDPSSIPSKPSAARRAARWLAWLLLALLIAAGAWIAFKQAKLHLALRRGHEELAARQFMRAQFWAARAMSVDPRNLDAMELRADADEALGNQGELILRLEIARRAHRDPNALLACARAALRYDQREIAIDMLNSLPNDFKDHNAESHDLMGAAALADHEYGLAEAHFVRAVQLDGVNPAHLVNLEAFRLADSPSPRVRADAAHALEGVLADPRASLFAARALLADAIRTGDRERARRFAEKLRSLPEHTFSDELNGLGAAMPGPAFPPALAEIEQRAAPDPQLTAETGDWLNAHAMPGEMLRWAATLPEPVRENRLVQMTEAESLADTRDWTGLRTFLTPCRWGNCEYVRRALLIRCQRELSEPWQKDWDRLASDIASEPPDGLLLAQLVIGWNWRNEAINLLWDAAKNPATDLKALACLWDLYAQTNETPELMRVAKAQIDLDPSNPARKNNYAFLSLLLNGASEHAARLAKEASAANPLIPEWAATHSYALHLSGRDAEARKVMENLPPEALARPGIALYYAIDLAATGDTSRAREMLAKLNPDGMLPEERKLAAMLAQQLGVASR